MSAYIYHIDLHRLHCRALAYQIMHCILTFHGVVSGSGSTLVPRLLKNKSIKPIFHCHAKPFALGTGVGLDP